MKLFNFDITGKTLLFPVIFLLFFTATAQNYHFDNYSVKEGLAQSSVYNVVQTENGNLWLGTASGISKFNGNDFINYTTKDGLADGAVKVIHIDSNKVIWLGHVDGGISRIINDKIEVILSMSSDITSFSEDMSGNLWIGSFGDGALKISNPYVQEKDSIDFMQFKGQEGLSDVVFQIKTLKNGSVNFITDVGVKRKQDKGGFDFYKIEGMPAYFQITYMYEDSRGDEWFGSYNGGLYHYLKAKKKLKIYDVRDGLAHNWISTITEDSKGNIWVGTWGGGLSKISILGIENFNQNNGLLDSKIRCITEDREGNILIGTKENGLLIYKGSQFVSYNLKDGLISNQVWSIIEDKSGNNWFATNKGISVFNNAKLVRNFERGNGLFADEVRFIKQDKKGGIWIGTWGDGVMKYNEISDKFEMNFRVNSHMSQPLIQALEVDESNNLWVGTTDGLVYYEIETGLVDRLTQSNGLGGNDITVLYTDSKNTLWVGARGKGISKINGSTITKVELERRFTAQCFVEDKEGNLWIGTEGQGVLIFNGDKIIKEYTVTDGLLSDYISLLNIDDKGDVWIGTNKGLNRFNKATNYFYSYSEGVGYSGIESKNNATYKDKKGNLWFGTIAGVVKMNSDENSENLLEPLTQITSMRVNLENREMIEGLSLKYNEKSIVFNYNSICLSNPKKVFYKVMLEGVDEDWREATQQTYVNYTPLPPGEYTFKVKASNNNGVWNKTAQTFKFNIVPPFWQTLWFIALCIIVVVVFVVLFIKIREKNLKREKEVLEEKVKERTEEVVEKSKEIELKNKDIIDSITYAKRIQDAILPTGEMFTQQLSDTFILFKPKDIVSGDFYWLTNKDNISLFAAVDCTGHGVPGAFMSIVGYNLLDKIVGEYGITSPDKILNELNKGVSAALRQEIDSDKINDGMDISLCSFDKITGVLEFSGAYNPLYILSKSTLILIGEDELKPIMTDEKGVNLYEVKANRFPIGSYSEGKMFSKHSFKLNKGDTVYMFSDGYADQFGGPKGKKFRYKQFKQLLLSINDKTMVEQHHILENAFTEWRGDLAQIDDVIVIGSRL